jgi:hypothetical protein
MTRSAVRSRSAPPSGRSSPSSSRGFHTALHKPRICAPFGQLIFHSEQQRRILVREVLRSRHHSRMAVFIDSDAFQVDWADRPRAMPNMPLCASQDGGMLATVSRCGTVRSPGCDQSRGNVSRLHECCGPACRILALEIASAFFSCWMSRQLQSYLPGLFASDQRSKYHAKAKGSHRLPVVDRRTLV